MISEKPPAPGEPYAGPTIPLFDAKDRLMVPNPLRGMTFLGALRRRLFGIATEETTFARRGFGPCDLELQQRLERVGSTFVEGYHLALLDSEVASLAERLDAIEVEWRGFAFEGAAMGLALLDRIVPWGASRWQTFLAGPGTTHAYMVHVGLGWALARVPWSRRAPQRHLARLDPLLGWLAIDGYGFHEGYFHWRCFVRDRQIPTRLSNYGRRVFDQGLGRSLWFVEGADVERLRTAIGSLASSRHADLWSGVGLASAYAGGRDLATLERLREAAGSFQPQLAQGAAFAAKARERAGNSEDHTELACRVLCGMSARAAAQVTDAALTNLPANGAEPAYETWRRRIQLQFSRNLRSS